MMAGRPKKRILHPLAKEDALRYLLKNLSPDSEKVFISLECFLQWPEDQQNALKESGLLAEAAPAQFVSCDQCEHQCKALRVMVRSGHLFVVCAHQADTGEVLIEVPKERREQLCFSLDRLAKFLSAAFETELAVKTSDAPKGISLGLVIVGNIRLILILTNEAQEWWLSAADNRLRVEDALGFDGTRYAPLPDIREYLFHADKSTEPKLAREARLLSDVTRMKLQRKPNDPPIYETLAKKNGISVGQLKDLLKSARRNPVVIQLSKQYSADRIARMGK
jgi:hypothetical protein